MMNTHIAKLFESIWSDVFNRKHSQHVPVARKMRLWLDHLEDRSIPSVSPSLLPAAQVSNTVALPNPVVGGVTALSYSPQIAISPLDPQKLVEVHATTLGLEGNYTVDGGKTWVAIPFPTEPGIDTLTKVTNLADPNIYRPNGTFAQPYSATESPSITFDRTGGVYIVSTQHNAANTSGAVVLHKFDFSGGSTQLVLLNGANSMKLYAWLNQDAAYSPIVAVDTNLPTYTDPETGLTQTDTLADQAFLAKTALANTNTLAASILATDLTLTLTKAINLPTVPFNITIGAEQLQVTNVAGTVLTVLRGQSGTAAAPHAAGATVTTLASTGAISATSTSFDVVSTATLPAVPFLVQLDNEQMLVTAVTGTTLTVTRGASGTTAVAHDTSTTVAILSALPKGVYVAWSVNTTQATNSALPATLSHIVTRVSPDGGQTFTTMQNVSTPNPQPSGKPYSVANYSSPKIVFSQSGGGLNFYYDYQNLSIPAPPAIPPQGEARDSTTPDGGVANAAVAAAQVFTVNNAGNIGDALPNTANISTLSQSNIPAGGNFVFVPVNANAAFVVGSNFTVPTSATVNEQFRINNISSSTTSISILGLPAAVPPATDTITVASSLPFQVGDLVQIGTEDVIIKVITGSTLDVLRGQNGTVPSAHAANSTITNLTEVRWGITGAQNGTLAAPHAQGSTLTLVNQFSSIPVTTPYTQNVTINSANLTTIKDLDVTLAIVHPNVQQLKIVLTPPLSSGLAPINLVLNGVDANGVAIAPGGVQQGISGRNLGVIELGSNPFINYNTVGTVFSDNGNNNAINQVADRRINDANASTPYIGYYKPEAGTLSNIVGLSNKQLSGTWTLSITDYVNDNGTNPLVQNVKQWSLNFTGVVDTAGFGIDTVTGGATPAGGGTSVAGVVPLPPSVTNVYPLVTTASGPSGIGSGVSLAVDNTLGSFSQFQGRTYMVYNGGGGTNTNVFLRYSDDDGVTWQRRINLLGAEIPLNDDSASDNFSEGNRPQFAPTVTVDPVTGTVVVTYSDARNDPALARVATTIVTSIDGGVSFSPISYLNKLKTATNFLTGQVVTLEPIPGNQSQTGSNFGFGARQGVVAYAGHITPVFASNLNSAGSSIFTAQVNIAAGPRIINGDMGVVSAAQTTADGTPLLSGINVQFDRPIDIATFDASDVTVFYQDPNTGTNTIVPLDPITPITALDAGGFGPNNVGGGELATQFFLNFATLQSKVGTYSYSVGPNIDDKMRSFKVSATAVAATPPFNAPLVSTNVPVTIPDLTTVTSDLVVPALPAGQIIAKVTVQVDISHTFDSDLTLTLISPTGSRIILSALRGGGGLNFTGTIFDDAALTPIALGVAPFTGSYIPESPLSALIGQNPQGTWQLEVADSVLRDSGTINSWSITVTPGVRNVAPVLSNEMDQNANAVTAETSVDQFDVPTPLNGVAFSRPFDTQTLPLIIPGPHVVSTSVPNNPITTDNLVLNGTNNAIDLTFDRDIAAGTFTTANADIRSVVGPNGPITGPYTVTTISPRAFRITLPTPQTLSGTYSLFIGPGAITDLAGNKVDTNMNAGLDVLRGETDPANSPIVRPVYQSNTSVAIPAGGSVTSTLSITDSFAITQSTTQFQFSGNQTTFLTAAMTATDTTMNVSSSTGFPTTSVPFTVQIGTEQIRVDAVNLNTWTVTRGVNNTFAVAHNSGDILTLGSPGTIELALNILHQDIRDLSATLTSPTGQVINLFANTGQLGTSPHANFANTVFDDSATNPIQGAGTPITGGPFNPQTPLSVLDGKGSAGAWKLTITNNGKSKTAGTLTHWELRLPKTVPGSGLGEPVADQISASFRIFTQATTNAQSSKQWTPVGPAANNSGANSGRIGGLAFDPADPSGNIVYVAGASGGVWKTTNFLTTDSNGPTYVPLTDLGPSYSLNIGSLATYGRAGDPNKTIIFAATGEGDVSSPGVGFLRSMDGGKSWSVLDSTTNSDALGNILPMASPLRDHLFVGSTSFKVIVDPTPLPNGNIVVYAALSGSATNGGIWRSINGGNSWTRIMAGNATDVVLAAGSRDNNGNLQRLYAAIRGQGVFTTNQAVIASFLSAMPGGGTLTPRVDNTSGAAIPTTAPVGTPNGAKGRIVLATPAYTNNPLQDAFYQGWIYAAVVTPGNALDGVYLSKDFGLNWTKLNLPQLVTGAGATQTANPTNNETINTATRTYANPLGQQGNYDISFTIDPNNPNITYLGGSADFTPAPVMGMIRIDATALNDPYALSVQANNEADGGLVMTSTTGRTQGTAGAGIVNPNSLTPNAPESTNGTTEYLNLFREPTNPFVNPSTLRYVNVTRFNNAGGDVSWMPFNDAIGTTTDQHELIAMRDPLTGGTRLIFGDDQGVFTGVDKGDGTLIRTVGNNSIVTGSRNGNLQITQFYYGASQPSSLAAQLAGAMFYGTAQDNGTPHSAADIIGTGNLNWTGPEGDATGVATDQLGSGTSYVFHWPCCGAISPTDFFGVTPAGQAEIARTSGLVQTGDVITNTGGAGQWPFIGGSNFAVNPLDSTGLAISSQAGRIFRSAGQSLGTGKQWFVIGNPTDLDSTYAPAIAFGAQDPSVIGGTPNDFIYAGTSGGKIFVTYAGGGYNGSSKWRNISTGLDGSPVAKIVTNLKPGSHEAYAVTQKGVYWMKDSGPGVTTPTWVKLNDLNGATTTASSALTLTGTTLTVPNGASALFPAAPFIVTIGTELMYVSSIAGSTWTVQRGFNNTTKATHNIGDTVTQFNPLFALTRPVWNNPNDPYPALQYLTSIQADWRYAIPDNAPAVTTTQVGATTITATTMDVTSSAAFPTAPFNVIIGTERLLVTATAGNTWTVARGTNGTTAAGHATGSLITLVPATHPVLYVGGEGGIYRSRDKGVTWTFYPNLADDGAVQEGGYLPNAHVTDLDLVLGNLDPTTQFNNPSTGYNMLLATTYGRGDFAIRLDNAPIAQFLVAPNSGPKVANAAQIVNATGTQLNGFTVTYGGEVDPNTFTATDVTITGPGGTPIPTTAFTVVDALGISPHNIYTISFNTPQSVTGTYTLKVGPDVRDLSGNMMDQNGDSINGQTALAPAGDVFNTTFNFTSNSPPMISAIPNQVVAPGSAAVTVPFTIGDKETPVSSLTFNPAPSVVTAPGYTGAPPTIAITGSGPTRTLTITPPAAPAHGSATVTITVQDGGGLQTASIFTINVDTPPTLPPIVSPVTVQHGTTPVALGLNASDAEGDPLTFTVSFIDPLFTLKQSTGLIATSEAKIYFNSAGQGEKYLINPAGTNYLLKPDGKLYLRSSGAVVATVGRAVYDNPDLLLATTGTPLVSVPNPLFDLKVKYGITAASVYTDPGTGDYYFVSSNGSNPGPGAPNYNQFILTRNNLLITRGGGTLVADFTALGYGNVYATPALLYAAALGTKVGVTATTTPKPAGPTAGGSITIIPDPAFDRTVTVTVTASDGALSTSQSYVYSVVNNAPVIAPIGTQSGSHSVPTVVPITVTDTNPDTNPDPTPLNYTVEISNATSANGIVPTANLNRGPLYDLKVQYGLNSAPHDYNAHGLKEIWFSGKVSAYDFYIKPDGILYTAAGAVVASVGTDVYFSPSLLWQATPTIVNDTLAALKDTLGIVPGDAQYGGPGSEKYLNGTAGGYFIRSNGDLYFRTGQAANVGTFIQNLGVAVYNNPAMLYHATGQTVAVTGFVIGSNLTLTPNTGFTGTVLVTLKVSDGAATGSQSFLYTVTNTPSAVGTPIGDRSGSGAAAGNIPINLSTAFTNPDADALSYSVTKADWLVDLKTRFGFNTAAGAIDNTRGGARFLLSSNGSNPTSGAGYFLIKPVAGNYSLIAWDGVTSGSNGTVVVTDLGLAVYNNPLLLTSATTPPALANVTMNIAANTLTIAWPAGYTGKFRVSVIAADGAAEVQQSFYVTIT